MRYKGNPPNDHILLQKGRSSLLGARISPSIHRRASKPAGKCMRRGNGVAERVWVHLAERRRRQRDGAVSKGHRQCRARPTKCSNIGGGKGHRGRRLRRQSPHQLGATSRGGSRWGPDGWKRHGHRFPEIEFAQTTETSGQIRFRGRAPAMEKPWISNRLRKDPEGATARPMA